jgi:sugar (pentulose or hexulose) kinase
VLCGIHDSNAAYYAHRAARGTDQPFAVISSGTWVIAMAHGADLSRLEAHRDMLANVDALGAPVATARFMGGREYAAIAGATDQRASASSAALQGVVTAQAMALPSFVAGSGPFPDRIGELRGAERLEAAERSALATLYLALMCEFRLDDLGARGDVIIDGPLASDALFSALLAALLPDRSVRMADSRAGIVQGALRLALAERAPKLRDQRAAPLAVEGLRSYRACWRQALN